MKAQQIIDDLKNQGFDIFQIKDALLDGEFLSGLDASQDDIEEAYDLVRTTIKHCAGCPNNKFCNGARIKEGVKV